MKTSITYTVKVDFLQFLEKALALKKENPHNYTGDKSKHMPLLKLAMQLTAINQEEAFTKALDRISRDTINSNIQVEPKELTPDEYEVVYHATLDFGSQEEANLFTIKHNLESELL